MAHSSAPAGSTNRPVGTVSAQQASGLIRPEQNAADVKRFRDLLVGSARGSMNLAAVRSRAQELRKSLDEIAQGLAFNAHNIKWQDTLDKFAVLQVQFNNLQEQLRGILKLYVAHPKSVNQSSAPMLPIMLATKELPEMEAERADLLAAHVASSGAKPIPDQFQILTAAVEAINSLVDRLTVQSAAAGSGLLDIKSPVRKDIASAARALPAPAMRQVANKGAVRTLKVDPLDKLMIAVATGEGLCK